MGLCGPARCGCALQSTTIGVSGAGTGADPWVLELIDGTITADGLADGSITTAKLADEAVTSAKIDSAVTGSITSLGTRTTALEQSMANARVQYVPLTTADLTFPFLGISSFVQNGGLVGVFSGNSVYLTRTASVSLHAMVPCGPVGAGGGFASLAILVDGATAASTRQYMPAATLGHLGCSATWTWAAGSTIQVQFGAVYSTGMTISTAGSYFPTLTIYEVGIP